MTQYSVPSFGGLIDFSDDVTIYVPDWMIVYQLVYQVYQLYWSQNLQ